jgi:hypothetical protein
MSDLSEKGLQALATILNQHQRGTITSADAATEIEELFKREPVNYKRVYSDPALNDANRSPVCQLALNTHVDVRISGFEGKYAIRGARPGPLNGIVLDLFWIGREGA